MTAMNVLVCGGVGYIGSHFVRQILESGNVFVVVYDNLSKGTFDPLNLGHVASLPKDSNVVFEQGDIRDAQRLDQVFTKYKPEAVFVF